MRNITGFYLTLRIIDEGLVITFTPNDEFEADQALASSVGWKYLNENRLGDSWLQAHDQLWAELMEDINGEGSFEMLDPIGTDYSDIGALTSSPIIALDVERDEEGNILNTGAVFYFPNYMIENELLTLMESGRLVFRKAEEGRRQ